MDCLSDMQARLYESADAESLDRLLGLRHGVLLDRDRIHVVGASGRPVVGVLAWRPGGIVHELRTNNSLASRRIADTLVRAGIEDAVSRPFDLHEAIFITDSDAMSRYALELGATEEVGKRVFTLGVRQ